MQLQTLYKYIEQKGDLQELLPLLATLTKHKTAVSQHAKQGVKDLEEVTGLLNKLGVKLQVKQDWTTASCVSACVFGFPF